MPLPEPIPVSAHDESFAGVTYHIRGELVPELQIDVSGQQVMFEHHVLLWKETQLNVELKKLSGAIKRKIAGLDFFVTRTSGSGRIAFSRDSAGQCVPLHLSQGEGVDVREHQYLAATDNLDYSFERIQGIQNMLRGGSGFFMDKFRATNGDALVWLHGHGNVFLVNLGAGEQLDVEAGAWLYKDPSVQMEAVTMGLKTGLMGGGGKLTWNRFTGPGRLAIQTMFINPDEAEDTSTGNAQAATAGGLAGALISGLTRG
ncbi:MAG TPA: AIM24 family protein [Solirubrobacteraceae bacterium]|nr:AIM24 family protein [Solirubrobacteraceae bacterium]